MKEIDYTYAYDLQRRINRLVSAHPDILGYFQVEGYDMWHTRQQSLFTDIKQFSSKTKGFKVGRLKKSLGIIKLVGVGGLAVLVTIFSAMRIMFSRRKVLVYSVDKISSKKYASDMRIQIIYDTLKKYRVPFFECFHTLLGRVFVKNLTYRRRMSIYLEGIDVIHSILSIFSFSQRRNKNIILNDKELSDRFTGKEQEFVRWVLEKYARQMPKALFRMRVLSWVLKYSHIRILLSIDDVRHYNELVIACRKNSIRTVSIQHGHFTKYHFGWRAPKWNNGIPVTPDVFLVWSLYWKKELLRLKTHFQENTLLPAAPNPLPSIENEKHVVSQNGRIAVLIPFETDAPKTEVVKCIRSLLIFKNISVFFKIRPDMDEISQVKEYDLSLMDEDRFYVVKNIPKEIDVVCGTYSTLLYEMVLQNVPVGIFNTSLDYGSGMIENGLAKELPQAGKDLSLAVVSLFSLSYEERKFRKNLLQDPETPMIRDVLKKELKLSGII